MADEIPKTPVPLPTYGQPQPAAAPPNDTVAQSTEGNFKDVAMTDASVEQAPSPAPAVTAPATSVPSPAPARTGTPLRTNGTDEKPSSRAASQHPDTGFTMPEETPPHGAPIRQYLNTKVTGHVLDGMKHIAKERPADPLRVLGDFLLERSKKFENEN
ncbi:hypothetical protein F5Y15DRAFT_365326 [Xylariaceae sp. FL0016]|nr:hypothetical protein F5Y15DRAFT_365326 [Xylariaceae sp. FL0016]